MTEYQETKQFINSIQDSQDDVQTQKQSLRVQQVASITPQSSKYRFQEDDKKEMMHSQNSKKAFKTTFNQQKKSRWSINRHKIVMRDSDYYKSGTSSKASRQNPFQSNHRAFDTQMKDHWGNQTNKSKNNLKSNYGSRFERDDKERLNEILKLTLDKPTIDIEQSSQQWTERTGKSSEIRSTNFGSQQFYKGTKRSIQSASRQSSTLMGLGAATHSDQYPDFFDFLFQPNQDLPHITQIASDNQFQHIAKLIDLYYNVKMPDKKRRGLVLISRYTHLNTQKNKDIAAQKLQDIIKQVELQQKIKEAQEQHEQQVKESKKKQGDLVNRLSKKIDESVKKPPFSVKDMNAPQKVVSQFNDNITKNNQAWRRKSNLSQQFSELKVLSQQSEQGMTDSSKGKRIVKKKSFKNPTINAINQDKQRLLEIQKKCDDIDKITLKNEQQINKQSSSQHQHISISDNSVRREEEHTPKLAPSQYSHNEQMLQVLRDLDREYLHSEMTNKINKERKWLNNNRRQSIFLSGVLGKENQPLDLEFSNLNIDKCPENQQKAWINRSVKRCQLLLKYKGSKTRNQYNRKINKQTIQQEILKNNKESGQPNITTYRQSLDSQCNQQETVQSSLSLFHNSKQRKKEIDIVNQCDYQNQEQIIKGESDNSSGINLNLHSNNMSLLDKNNKFQIQIDNCDKTCKEQLVPEGQKCFDTFGESTINYNRQMANTYSGNYEQQQQQVRELQDSNLLSNHAKQNIISNGPIQNQNESDRGRFRTEKKNVYFLGIDMCGQEDFKTNNQLIKSNPYKKSQVLSTNTKTSGVNFLGDTISQKQEQPSFRRNSLLRDNEIDNILMKIQLNDTIAHNTDKKNDIINQKIKLLNNQIEQMILKKKYREEGSSSSFNEHDLNIDLQEVQNCDDSNVQDANQLQFGAVVSKFGDQEN